MRVIINIDVPDLSLGIDFYTRAIGLRHSRTLDKDVAELEGVSSTIYLLEKSEGSSFSKKETSARSYARHWTPVHLDFVVDELQDAKERAIKAGAICESECVEWMGSKCITFSDPFGHGFCLIEFGGNNYQERTEVNM
jgi:predicted enzyme related to lactoylglutathione lyase